MTHPTKIEALNADEIMHVSGGGVLWPWIMNAVPGFNPPWRSTENTILPPPG